MNNNFKENINFPNYWNWKGFKICWSVTGEDNEIPIIFLHGFGASRKHWRNNLGYFAKGIVPLILWIYLVLEIQINLGLDKLGN